MNNTEVSSNTAMTEVVREIKTVLEGARANIAREVNNELLNSYWNIGRIICEYEQSVPDRADYGKQTLNALSKELTQEFGKGFSRANLYNMRLFYQTYEKIQTVSGKLSWSPGHIIVNYSLSLIQTNVASMKKKPSIPVGLSGS